MIVELSCGGCGDPYTPSRDDLLRGSDCSRRCPACGMAIRKSLPAHAYLRVFERQQCFTSTRAFGSNTVFQAPPAATIDLR